MKRRAATAAGLALAMVMTNAASAAPRATLRVQPRTVRIGGKALILGSHLRAGKYYTFLVAIPDGKKPRARTLIPAVAKANKQGNVRVQFVMPLVTVCGRATLYATPAGSLLSTSTSFILTGCKASSSGSAPPPPPNHKKKH